jgi:hypothetical protein
MAPTKPAPRTAIRFPDNFISFSGKIFLARCVMVQKRNKMVKLLAKADMAFIIFAAVSGPDAKMEKNRAIIIKRGAPGGCITSSL